MKSSHCLVHACVATLLAGNALAQDSANDELDTIDVIGRGELRQVQRMGAEQIALLPGGTSPLKALEKLPGVNFQSADPFGAYEWSTRITVRGFNQNQLGFTLDDVPLGDMSYGNHNGLHISRAISPENIRDASLSQGAGSLRTASTSNLGGTVEFRSSDPADEFALRLEGTAGSESMHRLFARLDSGALGTGTRFYLSVADHSADKWRGDGEQQARNFAFKALQPMGEGAVTAFANYSDRAETDYQDLSFAILDRRGYAWDNWYPDWTGAVAAANACAASGFSDGAVCDDAYWNAAGLREDLLAYVGLELPFASSVTFRSKVYLHQNEGQGLWGTPYVPTPGGAPLSIRTTEYDIDRKGLTASLQFALGAHTLQFGGWYESNDFNNARRFYGEPSIAAPTRSFEDFQRNPLLTQWEYDFDTRTVMLFVQDEIALTDSLRVSVGAKSVDVRNEASTVTGDDKTGTIDAKKNFLPQVGVLLAVDERNELFGNIARNMRAFVSAGTAGPFGTTAAGFAAIRDTLKPEISTTYEAGWRYTTDALFGSLAAYHVQFENRLLSIQQGQGIIGNPSVLANVGDVTTNGAELAVGWKPVRGLTWFTSFSWNDSTFDDDYVTNGNTVDVSGRQVPDAPKTLLRSELTWDFTRGYVKLDGSHVAKRYYTYQNDAAAPSYTLLNASAGLRFGDSGWMGSTLKDLTLQFDVTNLTDKRYIATVGSNGFPNSDAAGTSQTLLTGAPRQFFVALKARL